MSREALSLDISRLVSRVVSGESIDTAERGAALAEKYPDLGMTGALIAQAIDRAAGMVGMIRNAPEPPKATRIPPAATLPTSPPAGSRQPIEERAQAPSIAPPAALPIPTPPVATLSIDDDLAAAIDAEIGNLVSGQRAKPAPVPKTVGASRSPLPPAAGLIRTSAAPARNGASHAAPAAPSHAAPATQRPEVHAAPAGQSSSTTETSAPLHQSHSSLFSSFRRALFRT